MFKVFIVVCSILPFPRGEILSTKCYSVNDNWQPSINGYPSKEQCLKRVDTITNSLKKNFQLLDLKKFNCAKTGELL